MVVHVIDPLADSRWDEFVLRHPQAGVFHSRRWLEALQRTYEYRPVVFSSADAGEYLKNGLVFCEVTSWITGRRLVSLPFTDHCEPLVEPSADEAEILSQACDWAGRDGCKYAEIRPRETRQAPNGTWQSSETFYLHTLPLDAPSVVLFSKLHKDCVQRKVRRAEKEGLIYEQGRTEAQLRRFYELLLRTRRRHRLPPQPFQWFRNLANCMGDDLSVRIASKGEQAVAAILTLSFKDTVVYKYGVSDERFNNLGGTPFLFWKTIEEAKQAGMRRLDLGRSDLDNPGLIAFKDRLGAERTLLRYYRFPAARAQASRFGSQKKTLANRVMKYLPDTALVAAGKLLYRHIG
jgi:CelD/BcsL family acetyltransferase involved in cellulose biosynthesis